MSLSSRLIDAFDTQVRSRGWADQAQRRVRVETGGNETVTAIVLGAQPYRVTLADDHQRLRMSCACPDFAGGSTCRHIWATVLQSDKEEHLAALARGAGRLEVVYGDRAEAREEETSDDFIADDDPARAVLGLDPGVPVSARAPLLEADSNANAAKLPWRDALSRVNAALAPVSAESGEVVYVVDLARSANGRNIVVDLMRRGRGRKGEGASLRRAEISAESAMRLPDGDDREILALLLGASGRDRNGYTTSSSYVAASTFHLAPPLQAMMLRRICATGRCWIADPSGGDELVAVTWDDAGVWQLGLTVDEADARGAYRLTGRLSRGETSLGLTEARLITDGGVLITGTQVAAFDDRGAIGWASLLRRYDEVTVPRAQADEFLAALTSLARIPALELPASLTVSRVAVAPVPCIRVRAAKETEDPRFLIAELTFDYEGTTVRHQHGGPTAYDATRRRIVDRDTAAEAQALEVTRAAGFRGTTSASVDLHILPRALPAAVGELLRAGFTVHAEGKLYRKPGTFNLAVEASETDWFDLKATFDFDGMSAELADVLAALKRGDRHVVLDDGSMGMLPDEWLQQIGAFIGLGTVEKGLVKFRATQVGLLDALLAAQPEATCDAVFTRLRDELASFDRVEPVQEPPGFQGELRAYQRDGLGWFGFLERFGFGGCLADDMGLGKTVQVLALLEARRTQQPHKGASLVVAPRSLIHNWQNEAARFAPKLRVLDHTGIARAKTGDAFADHDLVLTTYGTLRRDAIALAQHTFDYVILDEAQSIKNATSEAAKAARLLRANHRLALSGTPVENRLAELWSLFEFLNPGMLGRTSAFAAATKGDLDPVAIGTLARALRPFILRRTKRQVAKDLPPRTEETLECEMEGPQRALYDELRAHYRASLLGRVARDGIAKSKIHVLEALLRLRQAACHPGLLDARRANDGSAKLDVLMERLGELRAEGNKALVFSQFTSLLALLRPRLDAEGIVYEYLDGGTRDRESPVERFQTDPACTVFLISLKAGGLGLNLTAAEYVFLLDPWWNPAVEAQAIDRAHRIGQTRAVFAYRLLCRDTIEEKIAALQEKKRNLAESVITADESLLKTITAQDLALLLS